MKKICHIQMDQLMNQCIPALLTEHTKPTSVIFNLVQSDQKTKVSKNI